MLVSGACSAFSSELGVYLGTPGSQAFVVYWMCNEVVQYCYFSLCDFFSCMMTICTLLTVLMAGMMVDGDPPHSEEELLYEGDTSTEAVETTPVESSAGPPLDEDDLLASEELTADITVGEESTATTMETMPAPPVSTPDVPRRDPSPFPSSGVNRRTDAQHTPRKLLEIDTE